VISRGSRASLVFLFACGGAPVPTPGPTSPPPREASAPPRAAAVEVAQPFVIASPRVIDGGDAFTCVLRGGGVACWGDNEVGQLGGAPGLRIGVVTVKGVRDVVEVAAGGEAACARTEAGRVWCWGALGADGAPREIAGVTAAQLAVGDDYACAVHEGGARCWGRFGEDVSAPTAIEGVSRICEIAVGANGACARTDAGRVWCWGAFGRDGGPSEVEGLADVVEIDAAGDSVCARLTDPERPLLCWSRHREELRPPIDEPSLAPISVHLGDDWGCIEERWSFVCWNGGPRERYESDGYYRERPDEALWNHGVIGATAVGGGRDHLCARIPSGDVLCWGDNHHGQLGVSSGAFEHRPQRVAHVSGARLLVSGRGHVCAGDASLGCWGDDREHQLGVSIGRASNGLAELGAPTALSASNHTCAVLRGGHVACWGAAAWGQLGAGPAPKRATPSNMLLEPSLGSSQPRFVTRVKGIAGARMVATSAEASCAVDARGIWCWGRTGLGPTAPRHGEPCRDHPSLGSLRGFGGIDTEPAEEPAPCEEFQKPRLVAGTAGARAIVGLHGGFCALLNDAVRCWDHEQLQADLPLRVVPNLDRPRALFGSGSSACAVHGAQELSCWTLETMFPRAVPGLERSLDGATVTSGDSGGEHACAVDSRGRVHCWGDDGAGQLGRLAVADRSHGAAVVAGVDDAVSVALGDTHSCALTKDGSVYCWGGPRNVIGGPEPLMGSDRPVVVEGL
jgi:alpha-tubulin suppressor-like RCC1 family protein